MAPAPAVDVEGEEGGGGKQQNQGVLKSEGDGGVLAPCAGGSSGREVLGVKGDAVVVKPEPVCAREGGDGGAGASTSYDLAPTSPEPLSDDEQDGDSTECSSSFGDSCCETGDEADGGNPEVNSPFPGNEDDGGDQPPPMPRKKKVTDNWRSAVRPMLWRFQWLELRMKDLLSQVSKYDRELALIQQEKELHEELSKKNGSRSEPVQLCRIHENSSMERRKRRRHEETVDTSLYVKKHQILSYFYDKQNKGADTDGLLIDDDSSGPVGDDIKSGFDKVGLLEPKEYDIVKEQLTLQKILLSIDDIQSQVHRLQDHLSKACSKQENRVSFLDNAHVEVAEKRLRTQKRSFSYKHDGYTKPQKKKNLNILLKEGNRSSTAVLPTLSERTDCLIEVAKGNGEQKSGERSQSHKKALTVDLLLGDGSLPNGHFGDFCKENTDDILIDNQAAKEGYQPFENVKHPTDKPPKLIEKVAATTPFKAENNAPSVEVFNTSASVKVEEISAPHEDVNTPGPVVKREPVIDKLPAVKHVYSVRKRDRKAKKDGKGSVAASNNLSKETFETPAAKQETETILPTAKKLKIGKITPLATEERAENSSSKKQATMNTSSHAKKQKIRNACSSANKNKQEAEDSSAAARKERTENKQEAEDSSAGAKKEIAENAPSKLRIEKAVLVAVNSRRSQRPRKPKIY